MLSGYIRVGDKFPEDVQQVFINYLYHGEERVIKGFFYMNGCNPTFSAYGSEINNVIGWRPRN